MMPQSFRNWVLLLTCEALALQLGTGAFAKEACPFRPEGVQVEIRGNAVQTYATAASDMLDNGKESEVLAIEEAELQAKALLSGNHGNRMLTLSGVLRRATCLSGGRVTVTVEIVQQR